MAERKQNFFSGAVILTAAVAITKVIGAIYKIPLGNLLDSEGMAHFYVAYNIYNLLLILSTAGLPLALSRLVARACALGRENQRRRILRTALTLFVALGLLCGGIMFCCSQQLATLLQDTQAAAAIRMLAPSVLFVCILSAIRGYTQGQGNMLPTALSQVIESASKLLVGLPIAWFLVEQGSPSPISAAGAIAGVTTGSALGLMVLLVYLAFHRSRTPKSPAADRPDSHRSILRQLLVIGIPVTVGSVGMSLMNLLDQTLVMGTLQNVLGYTGATATTLYGQYTFGMTLFLLPSSFIYPMTISLVPAISGALARRDRAGARRNTAAALKMTALLAMPCGAGLSVLALPILNLLYPRVPETAAAAAYHLSVLGIACIFVCLMVVTTGILQAYGHELIPVLSLLAGGLLKVVVNFLMVADPQIGILGAPVSTLLCYVLIVLINLIAIARVVPDRPGYLSLFARPAIATVVMAFTAKGGYALLSGPIGQRTCVPPVILICALLYGILVILLGAVTREDLSSFPKGEKLADLLRIR